MHIPDELTSDCPALGLRPAADGRKGERATVERGQHGQSLEVRDGVQRVVPTVAAMLRDGDLTPAQAGAAERYYRDYVLGVVGARNPEGSRSGAAPDAHGVALARIASTGRIRAVRTALGFCGEVRLKMFLVEELSFSAIADKMLPGQSNGRKKIAAQMALLLEQLAEFYTVIDRTSRGQGNPS